MIDPIKLRGSIILTSMIDPIRLIGSILLLLANMINHIS